MSEKSECHNRHEFSTREKHARISETHAARFNTKTLKRLQKSLDKDPEQDITTSIPIGYSKQLEQFKSAEVRTKPRKRTRSKSPLKPLLTADEAVNISRQLSTEVQQLLSLANSNLTAGELINASHLCRLLDKSDLIWSNDAGTRYVFKCNDLIALKVVASSNDTTEYSSLQYLALHKPSFCAPKPHGLLTTPRYSFLFQTFIAGETLQQIWSQLEISEKISIRDSLEIILTEMRSLHLPADGQLGGTAGEGCKDMRRFTRTTNQDIRTAADFHSFQYEDTFSSDVVLLDFMKDLVPFQTSEIVFTHGDIRPANIIMRKENQTWHVASIIDWELSGFYPEDFECTKTTNTLCTDKNLDWFLYIPPCISPKRFPLKWLYDRVFDHVAA